MLTQLTLLIIGTLGTVASSTQNNEGTRSILGDEPLQSQPNTARNSIASRAQTNSSPTKLDSHLNSSAPNYCYSSSENSLTNHLNGHANEENGTTMQRMLNNDENEHRTNLSAANLNETAVCFLFFKFS